MNFKILVTSIFLLATTSHAANFKSDVNYIRSLPSTRNMERVNLKVLTYNVKMIPCLKNKSLLQKKIVKIYGRRCPIQDFHTLNNRQRAIELAKIIKDMPEKPDVIFFQEALSSELPIFQIDHIKAYLKNLSGYHFYAQGPRSKKRYVHEVVDFFRFKIDQKGSLDSGLLIASRHPIKNVKKIRFKNCNAIDCASSTGAIHLKIYNRALNRNISILNTHLQAFSKYEGTRIKQIDQMRNQLMKGVSNIAIFAGDFNFRNNPKYRTYKYFRKKFPLFMDASLVCKKLKRCKFINATAAERNSNMLDHVFFKNTSKKYAVIPKNIDIKHHAFKDKQLSDHKAKYVSFDIFVKN